MSWHGAVGHYTLLTVGDHDMSV